MKKFLSALSLSVLALFVVGCADEPDTAGEQLEEAVEEAADGVGNAVEEAADEVEDATE